MGFIIGIVIGVSLGVHFTAESVQKDSELCVLQTKTQQESVECIKNRYSDKK